MSHKPDVEKTLSQDQKPSTPPHVSHPFLLTDDGVLEQVQVELVEYPVAVKESQLEALVADAQCEV